MKLLFKDNWFSKIFFLFDLNGGFRLEVSLFVLLHFLGYILEQHWFYQHYFCFDGKRLYYADLNPVKKYLMKDLVYIDIAGTDVFLEHRMDVILILEIRLFVFFVTLWQNIIGILFKAFVVLSYNLRLLEIDILRILKKLNAPSLLFCRFFKLLNEKQNLPSWRNVRIIEFIIRVTTNLRNVLLKPWVS